MNIDANAKGVQTPVMGMPAETLAERIEVSGVQSVAAMLAASISASLKVTKTEGTGTAAKTGGVPEMEAADEAKAAEADLEALLAYLQMEMDEKTAQVQAERIKSLKGQLESAHDSQMAKINKSIEEAKKQEKAAKAQKILSWIGAIFACIVAAVVTVTTGGLAAGFAVAGAAIALSGAILSSTGADKKIQKWMTEKLQNMHPDWSKQECQTWAAAIYGGCQLLLGLATSIGGGVSAATQAANGVMKVSQSAAKMIRLAMNVANGVMQASSMATTAATTATGYSAGMAAADAKEAEGVLAKLQKFLEESQEDLEAILQQIADGGARVLELLESKTDTLNKISQEISLQSV